MKKLVFAAISAMVLVSVSNVFASNKMASVSFAAPVDSVAPAAPADTTVAKDTAKSACCSGEAANQQVQQESQPVKEEAQPAQENQAAQQSQPAQENQAAEQSQPVEQAK